MQGSVGHRARPEDVEDLIKIHFATSAIDLLDEDNRMPGFDSDRVCTPQIASSPRSFPQSPPINPACIRH